MPYNDIDGQAMNEGLSDQTNQPHGASKVKMEELGEYAAKLGQSDGPSAQYSSSKVAHDGSSYEFEDVSDVYY